MNKKGLTDLFAISRFECTYINLTENLIKLICFFPKIIWIDSYLTNLSDAIKKRCFDKSILYIDTRFEKPSKELLQILGSNLQLMELSYGQKFLKSLSVLIIVDEEITEKLRRKSEKYVQYILKDYFPENSVPKARKN